METIIVIIIIAVAAVSLIRMFKKQADGKSGCACDQKCTQCPMEKNLDNADSPHKEGSATVIPNECEESV